MLNSVSIMGRLTAEPELKTTTSGKYVLSFTIANDKDTKESDPNWVSCVAWEKKAEFIAKYFHKGSMIAINGAIATRNYQNLNGDKIKVTEINVWSAYFASSKQDTAPAPAQSAATPLAPSPQERPAPTQTNIDTYAANNGFTVANNDDLPF